MSGRGEPSEGRFAGDLVIMARECDGEPHEGQGCPRML